MGAPAMTKQQLFEYCLNTYGTTPDYPFDEDFETAVLRHADNRKWYALVMRVSRRKFGFDSDEVIDVVNLKLPVEMFGSFGAADGVYPAYHMNKLHWISVLLPDAHTPPAGKYLDYSTKPLPNSAPTKALYSKSYRDRSNCVTKDAGFLPRHNVPLSKTPSWSDS